MPEMEGLEKLVLKSRFWKGLTQRLTLPWILRFANFPAKAQVLEVGSGGGFNAEVLIHRFPGWNLTASDYDSEMVAIARQRLERFSDHVDVQQADATALRFETAAFDIVIAIFVWHHVGDWRAATAEVARVLKPGGRFLLVDLTAGFFPGPVAKLFPPATRYRSSEVRSAFADAGFSRWKIRTVGPLLYRAIARR